MAKELLEYLTGWLLHHILIQDMVYKPFVSPVSAIDDSSARLAPLAQAEARLQPSAGG